MKSILARAVFLICLFSLIWHIDTFAVSLSDQVVEKLRQEGKLGEWTKRANLARSKGVWQPNPDPPLRHAGKMMRSPKLPQSTSALAESLRAIVLLVDFDDKFATYDTNQYHPLFFSLGTFPTGSMRDYYQENSYQQFDLSGAVFGWIRAPRTYSYYVDRQWGLGGYPRNAQKLVEDAVDRANPYVNFANFDKNGDGWVDALIVVHAGPGAEETGNLDDIWSHSFHTSHSMNVDGKKIYEYVICPEKEANGDLVHIGVFCHEFGHTLGLRDLYDADGSSEGLGHWSLMASGSWTNNGMTPAHLDAWSKSKLGWIEVDTLTSNLTNVEILQIETTPKAFRLWTNGVTGSQYFLVENRQKTRFDSYLDGEGLLIYHVDESIISTNPNNYEWCPGDPASPHFKIALEQADARFDLEGCYGDPNRGDAGDPFPGSSGKSALDDTTTPSSRDYYNDHTQVAVWNICSSDSVMYANLDVTWSRPNPTLEDVIFNDSTGGNGNGRPEPGETLKLYLVISNAWATLFGAHLIASADTDGISFSVDSVYLGDISSGDTVDNFGYPLEFTVGLGFPSKKVTFTFHTCGNGGAYCRDLIKQISIAPEILLVDDDNFITGDSNYVGIYKNALDSLGAVYDIWDKKAKSLPSMDLSIYPILIWYTGNHRTSLLSSQDVTDLMNYLDGGGKLFLTSQDAAEKLSSSGLPMDSIFLADYLHASYRGYSGRVLAIGVDQDPIGDTLYIWFGGDLSAKNQISKDALRPHSGASEILRYTRSLTPPGDSIAGIKYQGNFPGGNSGKVVFFGFGFEGLNRSGSCSWGRCLSRPAFVMQRVLDWLRGSSDVPDWGEELTSLPKAIELYQNHPNPFNPVTSIRYTVGGRQIKAGDGSMFAVGRPIHTTLKIYNVLGQCVRTLVDEEKIPGNYNVIWDGKDDKGKEVASGIYFYQLKAGEFSETRKMILLK